ncbi:phage tail protein [Vibrio navarrensis]|uniref:phage tail protein n=1 Tax=Vibrio navarrensis TaxID=29495 RepID=UPI00155910F5|nr:tail fiber protein [Vibrio navarrensis]
MEPYLGNIQMFACNFAPKDYAFCDGSQITITQNPALYSLLSTTFGGNSTTYFNLPDLRGRMPVHPQYGEFAQGLRYGFENISLTQSELPAHRHDVLVTDDFADALYPNIPKGTKPTIFARVDNDDAFAYGSATNMSPLSYLTVSEAPNSNEVGSAHNNVQPSTVINFCIALNGVYPQRN